MSKRGEPLPRIGQRAFALYFVQPFNNARFCSRVACAPVHLSCSQRHISRTLKSKILRSVMFQLCFSFRLCFSVTPRIRTCGPSLRRAVDDFLKCAF